MAHTDVTGRDAASFSELGSPGRLSGLPDAWSGATWAVFVGAFGS